MLISHTIKFGSVHAGVQVLCLVVCQVATIVAVEKVAPCSVPRCQRHKAVRQNLNFKAVFHLSCLALMDLPA
jgi:hypothetical protein